MIPFFHLITGKQKPPTRQENMRAFHLVLILLTVIAITYVIIALLVFGHL